MWLSKTKIASQCSGGPHAYVRHLRFHFGQGGLVLPHERGSLNASMRRSGANFKQAVAHFNRIKAGNNFEVDQVAIVQRLVLHGEQEFSPTGVNARVLAIM